MGVACFLAIGDELVSGRVRDANAAPVATALLRHGFAMREMRLLPDDKGTIVQVLRDLAPRCDLLVVSGGLGPTEDDLTAEAVAEAAGVALERNAEAEALVSQFFAAAGRTANAANLVQADLPCGARPFRNPQGTAPGFVLRVGRCDVLVLPGVPTELQSILQETLEPWFAQHPARGAARLQRTLVVAGIPEAEMGTRVAHFMERDRLVQIGSYPGTGEIRLVLSAPADSAAALDSTVAAVAQLLGADLVSTDGQDLAAQIVALASARGLRLATAESLTGGMLAARIVAVPGASACFAGGVVAYNDDIKAAVLGLAPALLQEHGAVSAACAEAMAAAALVRFAATHALATTGVAGPAGGTSESPVGTVFIALATAAGVCSRRLQIPGVRAQVRERACTAALDYLRRSGFSVSQLPSA
ncbi:MAG: CinA family nicotinamide mononucleotide deamidase-related protein [Planctomycetes bacterium]|nr:CinA family nicotinamide mononucleotide deamidase-related protein [Planctomycetota bacterium]